MSLYLPTDAALQYHAVCFMPTYESYNNKNNYSSKKNYNTWDNWFMIPTSDPYIPPSQVLTNYTSFEYWDGSLDETEVLDDKYYRQMISADQEFLIDFNYIKNFLNIYNLYSDILESIHGQEKLILFATDMTVMYKGRVYVDGIEDPADGSNVTVTLKYNVEPYIYSAEDRYLTEYYSTGNTHLIQMA